MIAWISVSVVAVAFVLFGVHFAAPPDCAFYLAWADSLVHLTLGFAPSFEALEIPARYCYITANGRLANDWPMGTGLVLLPVSWLGLTAMHAWVLVLAIAATALWARAVEASNGVKAWALAGMVLGTPLLFYGLFGPFFSHVVSFAVVTAFLGLWSKSHGECGRGYCLALGMLLGLAVIIRPQNLLLCLVFLMDLSWWKSAGFKAAVSRIWLWLVLGFAVGIAPRLPAYQVIYGNAFALPKLDEMHWFNPALGKTLFSDYHGIIPWTPIMVLGLAGLLAGLKHHARVAGAMLLVLVSQVYVNAANEVWWSGGSFGNRRLTDYSIVVAFGLVYLLQWAGRGALLVKAGIALCSAWSVTLALAERRLIVPLDRYVPFTGMEFWRGLGRVYTEPGETMKAALAIGRADDSVARILAGLALAGLGIFVVRIIRNGRGDRLIRAGSSGMIIALAVATVVCVVSAARTPVMEDSELTKALPSGSTILWDNYIELAGYHLVRKEFAEAEAVSAKAVTLMADAPAGYWYRGVARLQSGNAKNAAADFRRVLELNPEHGTARELLLEAERMGGALPSAPTATGDNSVQKPATDWRVK